MFRGLAMPEWMPILFLLWTVAWSLVHDVED